MKIYIFDNSEALFERLSSFYIKEIKSNPSLKLGLATGGTPVPLYAKLVADHKLNGTSYQNVKTFNLDEYIGINENHEQSYRTFMNSNLFNHIDIKMSNTNIPRGNTKDNYEEIRIYNKILEENVIDIQLLGIGTNGHIGFNEPDSQFDSKTRIVSLSKETRYSNERFFKSIDEVPTHAITMGIGSIMNAKKIILVATGNNKASIIKKMIEENITKNVPASILQTHDDVVIYLDKEAASLLSVK
ncbi:glucosamine-6-phosphate deaminase [Haploplasma axanthum]|nr:glucosamine-6-phosphate deaminase [Haploplasma axanthum]